jgi:FKBP-type peptidyl-prolyl cis-trans isomerase
MHRFDTWRIYIPYTLGYGSATSGSIRGYSTLIFDVTLYDFAEEGHAMTTQVGLTK